MTLNVQSLRDILIIDGTFLKNEKRNTSLCIEAQIFFTTMYVKS
jgi:hypothetical protein